MQPPAAERTTLTTHEDKDWATLACESWLLGVEAWAVIWLRGLRMTAGGHRAQNELQRMVSEKVVAGALLWPAILAGGVAQTPEAMAARSLAHYRKPVRANQRRLAGRR